MAVIRTEFLSEQLRRIVPFTAVLPNDPDLNGKPRQLSGKTEKFKTLYLLHGYTGNENDWLRGSCIERLARRYHFAVIMPAGENSFYLDNGKRDSMFGAYLGEELVQYTRMLFPLSERREDTCIGGLSMGGYGAMRTGLKYNHTFSRIMSFSGAFIELDLADKGVEDTKVTSAHYLKDVFGEAQELAKSDMDPRHLFRSLKELGDEIPSIYMTCGTEDPLLRVNRELAAIFREEEADLCYQESEGEHDWDFWNKYLEDAVRWMLRSR